MDYKELVIAKLKLLPEDPDLDIINTLSGKDGDNDDDDDDDDENAPPTKYILKSRKSLIHQHVKMQKH